MPYLLLGGTGQVGQEIRRLSGRGFEVVAPDRTTVDLCDRAKIKQVLEAKKWDAVINAAAYTDVDGAEANEDKAFLVNGHAPEWLAEETANRGIPIIHISTDYVFDGRKGEPYLENDLTAPINVYGLSKLAGEEGVRAKNQKHVIIRSSWVYSAQGKNFVRTILRLAAERDRLTVVADQRGCPTAASDIAKACIQAATNCASDPDGVAFGLYHFAGGGEATWFEFACAIVEFAADHLQRVPQITPINTSEYPTAANRPLDSRLDCSAIARNFGAMPRPWRQALRQTIEHLLNKRDTK
jgi:dTDP-4-dehydrorhamnose reductase